MAEKHVFISDAALRAVAENYYMKLALQGAGWDKPDYIEFFMEFARSVIRENDYDFQKHVKDALKSAEGVPANSVLPTETGEQGERVVRIPFKKLVQLIRSRPEDGVKSSIPADVKVVKGVCVPQLQEFVLVLHSQEEWSGVAKTKFVPEDFTVLIVEPDHALNATDALYVFVRFLYRQFAGQGLDATLQAISQWIEVFRKKARWAPGDPKRIERYDRID